MERLHSKGANLMFLIIARSLTEVLIRVAIEHQYVLCHVFQRKHGYKGRKKIPNRQAIWNIFVTAKRISKQFSVNLRAVYVKKSPPCCHSRVRTHKDIVLKPIKFHHRQGENHNGFTLVKRATGLTVHRSHSN